MTLPPPVLDLKPGPATLVRRGWLKLVAAGGALAALLATGTACWQLRREKPSENQPVVAPNEPAMIERLVDLLVPRDETPGAVDLGIHSAMQKLMQSNAELAQTVRLALTDLDQAAHRQHGARFLALLPTVQTQLLLALSQAATSRAGGRGFLMLRHETMNLYYSHPLAWPALGFDGPPQPLGFMDYSGAPKQRV